MNLPPQHDDTDPRDDDLSRRSGSPALSPVFILIGVALLAALAYVVSAMI